MMKIHQKAIARRNPIGQNESDEDDFERDERPRESGEDDEPAVEGREASLPKDIFDGASPRFHEAADTEGIFEDSRPLQSTGHEAGDSQGLDARGDWELQRIEGLRLAV